MMVHILATGHKCHDRAVIMSLEKLPKLYLQYTGWFYNNLREWFNINDKEISK